jgi:ESCRT-I complex subunit TSG101
MAASHNSQALSDEQIRLSLLSAVEDKMRRRLKEIVAQQQAEMETMTKTQEDLQKGQQKLDAMLAKLESEQNDVERNIRLIQEKDAELKEALSKMENKEEVSIDDAVQPTAPLYKQLLNAFAEEQATEDAIYYMGEALRKGVIELDVFLKQVRELSRKQFTLRMLIHKCRQKAGLPDISG